MTSRSNAASRSRASAPASSSSESAGATAQATATSPPAGVDLSLTQEAPLGFVVPSNDLESRAPRLRQRDGGESDDHDRGEHDQEYEHGVLRDSQVSRRENTGSEGRVASFSSAVAREVAQQRLALVVELLRRREDVVDDGLRRGGGAAGIERRVRIVLERELGVLGGPVVAQYRDQLEA